MSDKMASDQAYFVMQRLLFSFKTCFILSLIVGCYERTVIGSYDMLAIESEVPLSITTVASEYAP